MATAHTIIITAARPMMMASHLTIGLDMMPPPLSVGTGASPWVPDRTASSA